MMMIGDDKDDYSDGDDEDEGDEGVNTSDWAQISCSGCPRCESFTRGCCPLVTTLE